MKDSLILGTGNSRYLKSVENFKTLYPTYDDFVAALVAGTLPIDFNGINTAGFQQVGDALGKNTLLKDATAALYGLSNEAVPDDVFLKIYNRLVNGGVMSLSLLWENAAPSSQFSEQIITLTDMDYDFFLICTSHGSDIIKASTAATPGSVTFINRSEQFGRGFSVVETGIRVETATASTTSSAGTVYNSFAIPAYIFGIRF